MDAEQILAQYLLVAFFTVAILSGLGSTILFTLYTNIKDSRKEKEARIRKRAAIRMIAAKRHGDDTYEAVREMAELPG